MMLMAKHKTSNLEFHRKAAGSLPWLLPLASCPLPSPVTAHLAQGGNCVRVSKGRGARRPWKQAPKDLGEEFHYSKYQTAL